MTKLQRKYEKGDAGVVILVVLVVALLGVLGWVFWQNMDKKNDAITPPVQQEQPKADAGSNIPEGWVKKTDEATGMSYAIPKNWMSEGCGDGPCSDVVVKKYDVDTTIFAMKGPSAINAIRYDTKANTWQVVDGPTGEKGDQSVITSIGKAEGKYEAIRYTGGDGMMAQTHIFVHKGENVYQLALPPTIGNEKIQNEKINKAAEVVKTITLK